MAHPFESMKNDQISKSRVSKITHGAASASPKTYRASGGRVHPDEAQDKKLISKMIKKAELGEVKGEKSPRRADRVERKKGGRVKGASVNINVISAPSATPPGGAGMLPPGPPPMPPGAGPVPPRPPMGGPMAPGLAGSGPSGIPGMMPRATGGRVKSGPAWEEGKKNGTPVEHDPAKGPEMLASAYPKRAAGGKIGKLNASQGVDPATKLPGGAGGGLGRLAKAHRYGG